jgi:hypothetical protein
VRLQSLAPLLFTLLAFQLALGLQAGVAFASTISPPPASPHESSANIGDDACPMHNAPSAMHNAASSTHDANALSHTPARVKAPLEKSADKHDCCKSTGCQCQCGNVPLAFNLSALRGASATTDAQPIRATGATIAPTDTHFRPPIAS